MRLPADRVPAVAELVLAEQACCPFLGFRLDVAGSHLDLTVRGPAGDPLVRAEPSAR